ncbi:uncharacterized protein LOC141528036 isoform X2 [Cotesia typhae]|uniref:uncharacterized protein LOC141528036 isoform X2 n=1 Tax=Cotesia typhae TaxID=2053667 RepID=UPI003D694241
MSVSQQSEELIVIENSSSFEYLQNTEVSVSFEEVNSEESEKQLHEQSNPEDNIPKFSVATIINVLKFKALPKNWSWTTDLVNRNGLVLCYLDEVSMSLKLRVKISENFKITLTNIKTQILTELNTVFF